jgi:hypothetical protein
MYLVPSDAVTAGKSSNGNHLAYTVLDVVVVSFATPYHSVAYVVSVYHPSNIYFQLLFGACTFSLATYKLLASFVYVTVLVVTHHLNIHPFASYLIVIVSSGKFDLITA